MKKVLLLSLALVLGLALQASAQDVEAGKQVLKHAELPAYTGGPMRGEDTVDESKTETFDYWFFFPSNDAAKTDAGYPLLLFLHGAGERGSDPTIVKNHGPAKLCDNPRVQPSWRFITVSPQCRDGKWWSPKQMLALIDQICETYPVDRSRIYVTGLSMGGFGSWAIAAAASDKIAAIAPICGGLDLRQADKVTIPVWAFHGDADPVVPLKTGVDSVNAVKAAGNPEVIFTVHPGLQHDSWTVTYNNPMLYDWLLSKSKK